LTELKFGKAFSLLGSGDQAANFLQVVGRYRFPTLDDRPKLHYMNAVLLESMRTAALVGPGVPHYTTDNIPVGDYVIPKGAVIFGSLYHAMNDPEYFKNPHRFDPERFLKSGKFVSDDRVKMSTNRFSPRRRNSGEKKLERLYREY
jgi:cytochrome P450